MAYFFMLKVVKLIKMDDLGLISNYWRATNVDIRESFEKSGLMHFEG